jgi:hypothetical protein
LSIVTEGNTEPLNDSMLKEGVSFEKSREAGKNFDINK